VFGLLAREGVVLDGIVAVAARVPPFTRGALHLDVPAVVFTTEAPFLVVWLIRH
jgi:hypothetical protein